MLVKKPEKRKGNKHPPSMKERPRKKASPRKEIEQHGRPQKTKRWPSIKKKVRGGGGYDAPNSQQGTRRRTPCRHHPKKKMSTSKKKTNHKKEIEKKNPAMGRLCRWGLVEAFSGILRGGPLKKSVKQGGVGGASKTNFTIRNDEGKGTAW